MKIFIDTNVLLEWMIPTRIFHVQATKLMHECFSRKAEAFISSHSLTDVFYITRKNFSLTDRKNIIRLLSENFAIVTENNADFSKVLNDINFFDLEDGLQTRCSEKANVDFIVTENIRDFSVSKIPVVNINDALTHIRRCYSNEK